MSKARLETFTDGVVAILITIMVLELRVPHGADWNSLRPLLPLLLSYTLSFIYLGIYWNNHHHMFQTVDRVNGRILWANMHLLFWLSLVPFATGWMGENDFVSVPTAVYGCVLLLAAVSYTILVQSIIKHQGARSKLRIAIGNDKKGMISMALYAAAIPLAFVHRAIAWTIYAAVALIWLAPDRRIEDKIASGVLAHEERGGAE
jgi:uncharacterized membrane protein